MDLFDDEQTWQKYYNILMSWKGTPYKHNSMVKQGGTDCTLFIGSALLELGVLEKVEYGYYPKDWYVHTNNQVLLESIREHYTKHLKPQYRGTEPELTPKRGDILMFWTTRRLIPNHVAVYLGDQMIHSRPAKGVEVIPLRNSLFESRLTNIFRIEVI